MNIPLSNCSEIQDTTMSLFPEYASQPDPGAHRPDPIRLTQAGKTITLSRKEMMPKGVKSQFGYSGIVVAISDGKETREYPIFHRLPDGSGLFLLPAEGDQPLEADAQPFSKQEVQRLYSTQYAELENLPLKGEPLLNPEWVAFGLFVKSVNHEVTRTSNYLPTISITIKYHESSQPIYEAKRFCTLIYDLEKERLEFRRAACMTVLETKWMRRAAEGAKQPAGFFTEPALRLFRGMVLPRILPAKHAHAPLPDLFFNDGAVQMLCRLRRQTPAHEWEAMTLDQLSAEILGLALAA